MKTQSDLLRKTPTCIDIQEIIRLTLLTLMVFKENSYLKKLKELLFGKPPQPPTPPTTIKIPFPKDVTKVNRRRAKEAFKANNDEAKKIER